MALVFLKLAYVLLAIRPLEVTLAVHLIVQPLAHIALFVSPGVRSFALNFVHLELTFVN